MAGTIIDSLTVTLGLDPSDFKKGQKEAAESLVKTKESATAVAKEMEAKGKQASAFFSQVKNEALGLIGVLLGARGLTELITNSTTAMVAMGRAAQNIGLPVGQVDAFAQAVRRHGGDAAAAAASLQGLTDAKQRFAQMGRGGEFVTLTAMLGVGANANPIEIIRGLIKNSAAHQTERGIQDTRAFAKMLGLDPGTINMILDHGKKGGVAAFDADLAHSRENGLMSPQMVERANALKSAWEDIKQAAENLSNVMVDKLSPSLTKYLEWGRDVINQQPELVLSVGGVASAFMAFSVLARVSGLFGLTGISNALVLIRSLIPGLGVLALMAELGNMLKPAPGNHSLATPGGIDTPWSRTAPPVSSDTVPEPPGLLSRIWSAITSPIRTAAASGLGRTWAGNAALTQGFEAGAGLGGGNGEALSHKEFVDKYMPAAIKAGRESGVDPRIILAQAAVESGWGAHAPGNNMFGIKGAGQNLETNEFIDGKWVRTNASFEAYPSREASFAGYAEFIKRNPRYAQFRQGGSMEQQLSDLGKSGYATAPNYSGVVGGIARDIPLPPPAPASNSGVQNSWNNHHVQVGDVHVHTNANDARGIANDIHQEMKNAISQTNRGLE